MGFFVSVPGVITFKKAHTLADVVEKIPLEWLLLETDCPFLAPVPFRGKRNEPSYIPYIAKRVAEIKRKSIEEVAETTTENALRLFGLIQLEETLGNSLFVYERGGRLYLNITNRCTNECVFCPKRSGKNSLWGLDFDLPVEPSAEDVIEQIRDLNTYEEVVFCGLGEPLLRLDVVKKVAGWLKSRGAAVRINTDGLANRVHGRDISFELKDLVDKFSISLNAPDPETYVKLTRTPYGTPAWNEVINFIRKVKEGFDVQVSVVDVPGLDLEKCREFARNKLGVPLRIRG
jgi:TatD DNase family protein